MNTLSREEFEQIAVKAWNGLGKGDVDLNRQGDMTLDALKMAELDFVDVALEIEFRLQGLGIVGVKIPDTELDGSTMTLRLHTDAGYRRVSKAQELVKHSA